MARLKAIYFSKLGPELLVCCLAYQGSIGVFSFALDFSELFGARGQLTESVSPRFLFIMVVIIIYLFVFDESLTS